MTHLPFSPSSSFLAASASRRAASASARAVARSAPTVSRAVLAVVASWEARDCAFVCLCVPFSGYARVGVACWTRHVWFCG